MQDKIKKNNKSEEAEIIIKVEGEDEDIDVSGVSISDDKANIDNHIDSKTETKEIAQDKIKGKDKAKDKSIKKEKKKKEKKEKGDRKKFKLPSPKLVTKLYMLMILALVFAIFVTAKSFFENDKKEAVDNAYVYDNTLSFVPCENDRAYNFIKDYFEAKKHLDFVNIYRTFNRDYVSMKDTEESKKYENAILYEHNIIKDYTNLRVFKKNAGGDDSYILICLYDMCTYYTEEVAPNMLIVYMIDDGNTMYLKDTFDIGESKYIYSMLNDKVVLKYYEETKKSLTRALANDANLKLAYNSLRQYDMNPDNFVLDDKQEIVNRYFGGQYDLEKEYIDLAKQKFEAVKNEEE